MTHSRKISIVFLLVVIVTIAVFLFVPAKGVFKPAAFHPQRAPAFEGPLEANSLLQKGYYIGKGKMEGPEELAVGPDGKIYTGTADGYVKRFTLDGKIENFVQTGGRPVGLDFHPNGDLYVADAYLGLFRVTPNAEVTLVADGVDGVPFGGFIDGVEAGPDGYIYISLASRKYSLENYLFDILEAKPNGELLRYDPATEALTVLADALHFPNGIAYSPDGDFLLVAETSIYRVVRYWLKGEKAGTVDVFADNLPGFPDGISFDDEGNILISLSSKRSSQLDRMHAYPLLKNVFMKLPPLLAGDIERYALLIALSPGGEYLRSYHDPTGNVATVITAAIQHEGKILLGSFEDQQVLVIDK